MHSYGSHAFSMINDANERVWVNFHFRTQQGIANLTDEEAAAIVANDRESHGRDLFERIERGDFPRWTLFIQVLTETHAKAFLFNTFDLTKECHTPDYTPIKDGYMNTNRHPNHHFSEVEQADTS